MADLALTGKSQNKPEQIRPRRLPRSAWRPGQSGNPGGRPRQVAEVRAVAQAHGIEAILRIIELMRGHNPIIALKAAEALLDRAYGRPMQAVEVGVEPGEMVVTSAQMRQAAETLQSKLEAIAQHFQMPLPSGATIDQAPRGE